MYRACIFDLDGTLTDTLDSLVYSVNETLAELKLPSITRQQCKNFVGNGARYLIEKAVDASGVGTPELVEQGMEVYGRIFQENCTYRVEPYDGILDMLMRLRSMGYQLAVLSNKPHAQTEKVVKTFFGDELFSFVQGQKEGVPRKPDPGAALALAKAMGCRPQECVYVGDSEVDMKTGTAAQMWTVGVSWGFRTKEILKEHGAHVIIDHPEELIVQLENKEGQ